MAFNCRVSLLFCAAIYRNFVGLGSDWRSAVGTTGHCVALGWAAKPNCRAQFLAGSTLRCRLPQRRHAAFRNRDFYQREQEGVTKDWGKAAELFEKSAAQGNADAQGNLGLAYARGQGVPKDLTKAAELFEKSATQGNANAQVNLGVSYRAFAQNNLGVLYEYGQGVPKNLGRAAELYQKAADQGHADAQYHLGLVYETGQGCRRIWGRQ